MARQAIYPFGRVGSLANVYRFPRSDVAIALADTRLFEAALAPVAATLAVTLADATLSASGSGSVAANNGTLAVTLDAATLAATGTLRIAGSESTTLANDTLAATGNVLLKASAALTLGDATLAATGAAASTPIGGEATATLADATLSATGALVVQSLHGRRARGKRVVYPDELSPVVETAPAPRPEPLPTLETARAAIVEAKAALEAVRIARIEAQEREERQQAIDALSAQIALSEARYEAARRAEALIVRRLHDEDELFLLAA